MTDYLRQFNGDIQTKTQLLEFLTNYIEVVAIDRMYKGQDVSHIKDAKLLLDGAFDELENIYGIKSKTQTTANQAK